MQCSPIVLTDRLEIDADVFVPDSKIGVHEGHEIEFAINDTIRDLIIKSLF